MINFLSSWAKSLAVTSIIISILEMLLPNNKIKKYIRVVMGLCLLFTIIAPFIKEQEVFSIENIDVSAYLETNNIDKVEQKSMDERIEELYIEELENDIISKIENLGFSVSKCNVNAKYQNQEIEIKKIELKVEKDSSNINESVENTLVEKIQTINIGSSKESDSDEKITKDDLQKIENFLVEEYEVSKECLKIN